MTPSISRREFITRSAIALAGTSILASSASCASSKKTLNLALIGAGTQGRVLLGDCLKYDNIRFKAVCDIWSFSQRYASNTLKKYEQEVNVYEDYRAMLDREKELDAVIIASPDFVHAEHAIACMEAGLDVYCEKEMAHNLESSRAMVEAERKTGRILQIGHQRRSNPLYQLALNTLDEDKLCGQITNCYAQWNKSVQALLSWPEKYEIPPDKLEKYGYESMNHFRNWRWFRKYSGGPVSDNGSHQIDVFSWFLQNNPTRLMASGGKDYYEDREWYEDVMAVYDYQNNGKSVRAAYQVINTNGYEGFFERFYGDQGTLNISEFYSLCSFSPEPAAQIPEWLQSAERMQSGNTLAYPLLPLLAARSEEWSQIMQAVEEKTTYMWHLENFFHAIRSNNRKLLNCSGEEAYKTAVAVFAVTSAMDHAKIINFDNNSFIV